MADVDQNQAANTDGAEGGDAIKAKIFVKSLNGSKQEYKVDLKNDSVRDLKTKLIFSGSSLESSVETLRLLKSLMRLSCARFPSAVVGAAVGG